MIDLSADIDVFFDTEGGWAEPTDYTHPDLAAGPVRVRAIWGAVEATDVGMGVLVDVCEVQLPEADMRLLGQRVVPDDRGQLWRRPDAVDAECWEILPGEIRLDAGVWVLRVMRPPGGS